MDIEDGAGLDREGSVQISDELTATMKKQNYEIVGTHSAVKLCSWTKKSIRGGGKCYKNHFYGIESSFCIQSTTNISCANSCIFCWRLSSTPASREWKWKQDDAEDVVNGLIKGNYVQLKKMRGVPRVDLELLGDAMDNPRHCALSLIGEAIQYPQINAVIDGLHKRRISTFIVTNAQLPDELIALRPVTQLYLSIDAPTPELLKRIDRPLFNKDYWERMLRCLDVMRERKERKTIRFTMIKAMNDVEFGKYAELVQRGRPDFIEVKGYTYSGVGKKYSLSIDDNVPYHSEIMEYARRLEEELSPDYAICNEYKPSCIALLARRQYHSSDTPNDGEGDVDIGGVWKTKIDFEKFFDLYNDFLSSGAHISAMDYSMA